MIVGPTVSDFKEHTFLRLDTIIDRPTIRIRNSEIFIQTGNDENEGTFLFFNECFQDRRLRFDMLGDGSFPVDVEFSQDPTGKQFRYKVFFFYPFNTHVHIWLVDRAGVRREAYSLEDITANHYIEDGKTKSIACLARFIMISKEISSDLRPLIYAALTQSLNKPSFAASELVVALLSKDGTEDFFDLAFQAAGAYSAAQVNDAGRYENGAAYSHRCRPLVHVMAASEHKLPTDVRENVLALDISSHPDASLSYRPFREIPILRRVDSIPRNRYLISYKFGIPDSLVINGYIHHLDSLRLGAPVRFMQDIVCRYNLTREVIEHADLNCSLKIGDTQEVVVQFGDLFEDERSIAYGSKNDFKTVTAVPDPYFTSSFGFANMRKNVRDRWVDWDNRRDTVFWRGSTTGFDPLTPSNFIDLPRYKLCMLAGALPDMDCRIVSMVQAGEHSQDLIEAFQSAGIWGGYVPEISMINYKFLVDIDGNVNSWGFFSKLIMGCCVLKVESQDGWRQWYYEDLVPYRHFVPVKADLSDFADRVAWCRDNDALCEDIARQGRAFALLRGYDREMTESAKKIIGVAQGS